MPESTSEHHLAPSTPEKAAGSSQSSAIDGNTDIDMVVLESSPGRPGSSRVSRIGAPKPLFNTKPRVAPATSSVSRLSSFYFRGNAPSESTTVVSTPSSISSDRAVAVDSSPPLSKLSSRRSGSPVAVDLDNMVISPRGGVSAADFGKIVGQYRWAGAEDSGDEGVQTSTSSRKRILAERGSSEEGSRKRATPVTVLSDNSESDEKGTPARGPRRGRLQRGARPSPAVSVSSSPPPPSSPLPGRQQQGQGQTRRTLTRRPPVPQRSIALDDSDEDSGDDADSNMFERRFEDIEPYVMQLFNNGSAAEIIENTGATAAEAQIVIGMRPFEDVDSIEQSLRKTRGVRLAMFNQYRDTLLGHAEVEEVISQCSGIFSQLKATMQKAGVQSNEATGAVSVAEGVELQQPKMISRDYQLKHYQLEGVEWISCLRDAGGSGILADEMGLGKTFQVISFICKGIEEARARGPSMVVCPSSTLDNWLNECAKFAPSLRVVAYYGSQPERMAQQAKFENEASYDVLVTTYNVATGNKMDRMFLKRRKFSSLILDEGHMVKNCMSSRYKWLMQIRAPFRLLLTGTPLQNNLQELVSLLTFILPQVFADSQPALSHAFKAKYAGKRAQSAVNADSDEASTAAPSAIPSGVQTPDGQAASAAGEAAVSPTEAQHINQAKTLLRPFVLRRRKCDVLSDLPTKTEIIVRLDLTEAQRKLYDSIKPDQDGDIQSQLMNLDASQLDSIETTKATTKDKSWISSFMDMRKVADHPLLLRSHYDMPTMRKMAKTLLREPDYAEASYEYVLEDMEVCSDFELHKICTTYPKMQQFRLSDEAILDSAKVQKLRAIVDECIERGEKLLLFSQFTTMLNVLEAVFKIWDIEYFRLDGQTKVDERQTMIDEYNSSESKVPVFLLSTKAGGFGINLTSANVVVIYDAGNNPSEERQAEDRAHRVGQVKDVRVYKLIGNNTIDEAIWESSQSKLLVEHMFWF
ncbi:DNA-dependent ATPase fun30 [Coemansia erecta]|uniref:DNA-dependent ATPase fun30 n=1 Tax=Coemansia erecta TaxID=147472 RepID=A0A9W7Y308_9FUNG|nr:DNA-dependent ATPase fun30 [Coemansia erecta]